MKRQKFSIPGRCLLSLFALILSAALGVIKAEAADYYNGMRCDYYYEINVGDTLTLRAQEHPNQTGIYWNCWNGIETGDSLKMGKLYSTHHLGNYGLLLISTTIDIDGVAYFEMSGNSATVAGTKPGIVGIISNVRHWYTYYDSVLKQTVTADEDAEQTTYAIIRVLGAPCTLTFNANGGAGSSYTQSATAGTSITLSSNRFTRDGYTFTGWNTKADGTGTSYTNGASMTPSSDLTLYAQWERGGSGQTAQIIDSGTCGANLTWTLDKNGVLSISGNGKIYDFAFGDAGDSRQQKIRSVIIHNGVTSIGNCAFRLCAEMTSVIIPGSVTSIGEWAFGGCEKLTNITIPNGVTSIEYSAFGRCTGLTSIIIPTSVTNISYNAFFECANLKDIYYCGSQESWGI